MGWQARDIPDQAGRVVVVTGATGGLGSEVARELARCRARVIMAVRNPAKGERVRASIVAQVPDGDLEVRYLELSSLAIIRDFAEGVLRDHPRLDLLVNNAGIMATPPRLTIDGLEWQVGVNHLGHFALTAWLLPALLRTDGSRVVTVSSVAALMGRPLGHERLEPGPGYSSWLAYGDSKVANYRFGLDLASRLRAAGALTSSLVAHPGLSHTDLQSAAVRSGGAGTTGPLWEAAARWIGMSPTIGARSLLRAATDPTARNGETYGPRWATAGPPVRLPPLRPWLRRQDVVRTWVTSEAATGVEYGQVLSARPWPSGRARGMTP